MEKKFGKLLAGCLAALACFSCGPQIPTNYTDSTDAATIYPDYRDVTIPPNIAPLRFVVDEEADAYAVRISGTNDEWTTGKREVTPDVDEWHDMTRQARGRSLSVEIFVKHGEEWTRRAPFRIHVAEEDIDPYMSYRLISPSYVTYHDLTINQRNLTNFDERVIYGNLLNMGVNGAHCINCHSFCMNDPNRMMLHMRAVHDGTYIIRGKEIERLKTKTKQTISNLTYPYWHPSGKYITTSVNDIKQFFPAVKEKKMEVFDLESDVVVYDVEQHKILSAASLITKDAFETFPAFSPDGKWLYFCSAPACEMPADYDKVRYHICRMAFDVGKGALQLPVDTLVRADSLSYTFPRISPDGRFLMYTETAYGQFPVWHKDAEIRMLELETRQPVDMTLLNSADTESYHSWSSQSDWVVFSSRRDNGLYTLPYICRIQADGRPAKPFLLPQEDPEKYDYQLYSYNLPELVTGEVTISPYAIQQRAHEGPTTQVAFE